MAGFKVTTEAQDVDFAKVPPSVICRLGDNFRLSNVQLDRQDLPTEGLDLALKLF